MHFAPECFITFVPACMVFSLPGSHYPSLFSAKRFPFSSKIEYRHHSSRSLPWHFLFSSFQVRLVASILYSQKHSQLTSVITLILLHLNRWFTCDLTHQTKVLKGNYMYISWCKTGLGLGWPQKVYAVTNAWVHPASVKTLCWNQACLLWASYLVQTVIPQTPHG